jgi:two-component system response regulator YesN
MRRILIVDDEQPVASGIAHILRRDFAKEYEVSGIACSGREAIEKAGIVLPDIILMDVRMTGFSGLEAIRELRKRGSQAAFIMVTAYERFEIAREAIELGVVDYLLKPVSTEALSASLAAAAAYLDNRHELEKAKLEIRELDQQVRSVAESALLRAVVAGPIPSGELDIYRKILGIQTELALVCAFGFGRQAEIPEIAAIDTISFERILSGIRYKTAFYGGPCENGLGIVFASLKSQDESFGAMTAIRSIILESAGTGRGRNAPIMGFGGVRSLEDSHLSWNEAVLNYLENLDGPVSNGILHEANLEAKPQTKSMAIDLLDNFRLALFENRVAQARLVAREYIELKKGERIREGREQSALSSIPGSSEICELISILGETVMRLRDSGRIDTDQAARLMAMDELYKASDFTDFILSVDSRMGIVMDLVQESSKKHSSSISTAMSYVRKNYSKQINLEFVAEEAGISANRLSRLFVEETGNGFSHYLVAFRIAKAKEMLASKGASVKEVSAACGYPDQNYFARLFKKITGLSPSAYNSGVPEDDDGN